MRGNNESNYIVMQGVKREDCAGGINTTITERTPIRKAIIVDFASTLR